MFGGRLCVWRKALCLKVTCISGRQSFINMIRLGLFGAFMWEKNLKVVNSDVILLFIFSSYHVQIYRMVYYYRME